MLHLLWSESKFMELLSDVMNSYLAIRLVKKEQELNCNSMWKILHMTLQCTLWNGGMKTNPDIPPQSLLSNTCHFCTIWTCIFYQWPHCQSKMNMFVTRKCANACILSRELVVSYPSHELHCLFVTLLICLCQSYKYWE